MRELREYKLLIFTKSGRIVSNTIHKSIYNTETQCFEQDKLKKQLYTNKTLKGWDYVLYGKDLKVVSLMHEGQVYDFQGHKDWANIKRYLEKKGESTYVKTKNLLKRYKDIDRAFQRGLTQEKEAPQFIINDYKIVRRK